MTPTEAIQLFCQRITWADRTQQATRGDRLVLIDDTCLALPCHWQDCECERDIAIGLAASESRSPALIIWGKPPVEAVESIWWDALTQGVVTRWLDFEAQMCERRLIRRITDGVDWQRTLPQAMAHVAQGTTVKPVYVWDD